MARNNRQLTAASPSAIRKNGSETAAPYPRTLEEIKMRKAVNQVKIDLAQAKLIGLFTPQRDPKVQAAANLVNRFDTIMQYMQYATLAVNVFKRLRTFFRKS